MYSLPKWPQMCVSGKPVTIEQAKDIIFRTDEFLTDPLGYTGGNNYDFNREYRDRAGLYVKPLGKDATFKENILFENLVKEKLGAIRTEYVRNCHASSAYIGGPSGWCWPDGKIYHNKNVGKWPSAEELLGEWRVLAKAFPYLDLNVTLMSGEYCEENTVPVFNIRVVNGTAEFEEPNLSVHGDVKFDHNTEVDLLLEERMRDISCSRELGLDWDWYVEFAEKVRAVTGEIRANWVEYLAKNETKEEKD